MTLLYHDSFFQQHDTGAHPERAARLRAIDSYLVEMGLLERCRRPHWSSATPARLALAHDLGYVDRVKQFAEKGGGLIESDTVLCEASYDVALRAAGAVIDAVERVVRGEDKQALCLTRPPGHHALERAPMGFCLFNNVALGARVAERELGLDRVLIVDWDVHHGNGTQAIFWREGQVGFFSLHRFPFYPGTGAADEIGAGPGLGATLNVPLTYGVRPEELLARFRRELERFATVIHPELVIVSAGFDAHRDDPVGDLGLATEHYRDLTRIVLDVAREFAGGRVVSVLEGGYHPTRLAESVGAHLDELLAAETPPAA